MNIPPIYRTRRLASDAARRLGGVVLIALAALLVCPLLAIGVNAFADTVVKDGDDIIVDGQDYRFVTADAFEPDQTCKDDKGADYDCGARAKTALEEIIGDKSVRCFPAKPDGNRLIARCLAGDVDLEAALVRAGWAFARRDFRPHDPERFAELCGIEKEAHEAKRGAWGGRFDIPYVWKGGRRKIGDVTCPNAQYWLAGPWTQAQAEKPEVTPTPEPAMWGPNLVPRWVLISAALLTPAIALLAVVIALMQWLTSRQKVLLALFERRMSIVDNLRSVVAELLMEGRTRAEDSETFLTATKGAEFLFGPEVKEYLDQTYTTLLDLHVADAESESDRGDRSAAIQRRRLHRDALSEFHKKFQELVLPYVEMRQRRRRIFGWWM